MSNIDTKAATTHEAYWDKYGIPVMTLGEALSNIDISIRRNQTRGAVVLISEAGEGKSQGIRQLARKHKRRVVDIRTAQFNLMGAGIPQRANEETGMFDIAVPSYMPKEGEKAILLFDEINQGQPHAIAMFFQLLEDRRIYDYEIPNDCIIVGLMNPGAGAYAVSRIESNPAINRRLMKAYVKSDFSEWRRHAESKDFHYSDFPETDGKPCHSWVLKFLIADSKALSTPAERDMGKQFCCPATWQTVSLSLYNLEAEGINLTEDRAEKRVAMTIGTVMARSLANYIRDNAVKVSPHEILVDYKPKSALRKRVLQMQKEPGGDYNSLIENVANNLFFEKLPPVDIAANFALFWCDMPNELASGFYTMLHAASKSGNEAENNEYMKALTTNLINEPKYNEVNERLNKAHDSFDADLKGAKDKKKFDPMP
jgi:hypothetical protein